MIEILDTYNFLKQYLQNIVYYELLDREKENFKKGISNTIELIKRLPEINNINRPVLILFGDEIISGYLEYLYNYIINDKALNVYAKEIQINLKGKNFFDNTKEYRGLTIKEIEYLKCNYNDFYNHTLFSKREDMLIIIKEQSNDK